MPLQEKVRILSSFEVRGMPRLPQNYDPKDDAHKAFDPTSLIVSASELAKTIKVPPAIHSGKLLAVEHLWQTERSNTAIAVIEPGGGLRPHFHRNHDEVIVFLSGHGIFRIGNEIRPIKAHDVVTVPAGVVHTTLRAETRIVLAAVFSPYFDLTNEDRVYVE
jgi:mannose-6-phosphate isomerase-like protein (cupin superfamily)